MLVSNCDICGKAKSNCFVLIIFGIVCIKWMK